MVAPPPNSTGQTRLVELDGFRALSILAVLAAHMLPLNAVGLPLNSLSGAMGMSLFFCLSGFLITRFLWQRPEVKPFLMRRFARIVPLIFLVSVIYCLVLERSFISFLATNTYTLNYWDAAIEPSISPLWSVAMEMQFYVLIALAIALFGRQGFWIVPIIAVLCTGMRIEAEVFKSIRTHYRIDEIMAGSLLAILWLNQNRVPERIPRIIEKSFWPVLFLWLLSCYPDANRFGFGYLRPYFTASLIGSVLLMQPGWQNRLLSHSSLRYVAAISFALYVWHSPFRHDWFAGGSDIERYTIRRPIGIAATFILAHLSTFYFEKPITDAIRRLTKRHHNDPSPKYRA